MNTAVVHDSEDITVVRAAIRDSERNDVISQESLLFLLDGGAIRWCEGVHLPLFW